jgi:hypothetical protein
VVAAKVNPGQDDRFREQSIFGDLAEMRALMLKAADGDGKVTLTESGIGAVLVVSPMLDLALTVDGHEVQSAFLVKNFGDSDVLSDIDPGATYAIESSNNPEQRAGRLLKRWDVDRVAAALREELLAQFRADPNLVVAEDGRDRLIARYGEGFADAIIETCLKATRLGRHRSTTGRSWPLSPRATTAQIRLTPNCWRPTSLHRASRHLPASGTSRF